MFRGTHTTRLDEKGRLKVPADFKRQIDENYGVQFYITSRTGTVAEVYPMQEWEEIERKLAAAPDSHPAKKKFLKHTNFYGQVVEMDGQGRLLLPSELRDTAQPEGRGCGDGKSQAPVGAQRRGASQGNRGGAVHRGR